MAATGSLQQAGPIIRTVGTMVQSIRENRVFRGKSEGKRPKTEGLRTLNTLMRPGQIEYGGPERGGI
jgi:hypothetical protein